MFALVDGNSFYASVEQVFDPDAARRPVVVLSNNDGCVVAATRDLKERGVEMFRPFFEIKDQLAGLNVKVFSSNYTLYDDMSRRLTDIYRQHAEGVEVYSIDECFLELGDTLEREALMRWGEQLRATVRQWTGIPVGIGVGPSKTLAKLANHMSKRDPILGHPEGVCVLKSPGEIELALGRAKLKTLWGVAGGTARRLRKLGITTPLELRDANPFEVRKHLGVVGQRLVYELRGEACMDLEQVTPDRKNVCVSRSFAHEVATLGDLQEAVTTFASQAAVKMRRQDLAAQGLSVFVQTNRHAPVEQYGNSAGIRFEVATVDTREISKAALHCLRRIYRQQHRYKKAGVMLHDLTKRTQTQPGLFDDMDRNKSHQLMTAMDTINRNFGSGTLRLASSSPFQLLPCRTWHRRSDHCSPRYTTRWEELGEVQAICQGDTYSLNIGNRLGL